MLKLRLLLAFNDWTSRPTLMGSHILGRPNFILIIQFSWIIPPKLSKVLQVVGQEEGGIVHPPGNQFLIDVSRLEKYHKKRFAMLKS